MFKLLWRLFLLVLLALGFAWLADRPGSVNIKWLGREIEMSVVVAVVVALDQQGRRPPGVDIRDRRAFPGHVDRLGVVGRASADCQLLDHPFQSAGREWGPGLDRW